MEDQLTKAQRRHVRELAGIAHKRHLSLELEKLGADVDRWRAGEIDPFELSDLIHRFHNGTARELYGLYATTGAWEALMGVRGGLFRRLLDPVADNIEPEILDAVGWRGIQAELRKEAELQPPDEPA